MIQLAPRKTSTTPIEAGFCLLRPCPTSGITDPMPDPLPPTWFNSRWSGFLYVHATEQALDQLPALPSPPFLFALLVHPEEVEWATRLPLRLLLRLGGEEEGDAAAAAAVPAQPRPFPLVCDRSREEVFTLDCAGLSRLSVFFATSMEASFVHIPDFEILLSSVENQRFEEVDNDTQEGEGEEEDSDVGCVERGATTTISNELRLQLLVSLLTVLVTEKHDISHRGPPSRRCCSY